jgi:tetratricopeptide (TPR) repeat protein
MAPQRRDAERRLSLAEDQLGKRPATGSSRISRLIDTAKRKRSTRQADTLADRRSARAWERQLIAKTKLAASRAGRIPTVAQVRPYGIVGVSPSKYLTRHPDPPYVRRDVDGLLDDVLERRRFALLVGDSKAGKSRTGFEALRRQLPRSPFIVPLEVNRLLAELVRDQPLGSNPGPPVLWLDEFDRYLGDAAGFERELLGWLLRRDRSMVVVATIDTKRWEALHETAGEIGWAARRILEIVQDGAEIRVATHLSAKERAEAERLYPEDDLRRGIGPQLVRAPELERQYDFGVVTAPVGWALVQAAVDWRRTGITRPIPEQELRELSQHYLWALGSDPPADEAYTRGLAWACRPLAPEIALLRAVSKRGHRLFRAFDHIVAHVDQAVLGATPEVPAATWDYVLDRATAEEAVRVGFTALTRGNSEAAAAAWSRASASQHRDAGPWATLNLGLLRKRQGDLEGAREAFERASASQHRDAGPWATLNLGLLRKRQGDLEGAREAFERASASQHRDAGPWATLNLGLLRKRQDDADGARAAPEAAEVTLQPAAAVDAGVLSTRAEAAPETAVHVANLLAEQGDLDDARRACEQAMASGHPDQAPRAAVNLGVLLAEQGDLDGARRACEQAMASGHPDQAPRAAVNLGVLLAEYGDVEGARAAFQHAADSGHPDQAPWAIVGLGILFTQLGDLVQARQVYQHVVDSGHLQAGRIAAHNLEALSRPQAGDGRSPPWRSSTRRGNGQ